jgi:hypothetical protein
VVLTADHWKRRIAAIRGCLDAPDLDQASRNLLAVVATWSPVALATQLGEAMELAAYWGREAVFLDGEDLPPTGFAAEAVRQSFREQVEFLRQKRVAPSKIWLDTQRGDHDRKFVVAGVTDMAMGEEFQVAIMRAAEEGQTVETFAKEFDRLVEKYGWAYRGERNWRIRTIYQTNMRTSFMAGRLKQMRDPDVVAYRPFWQYKHGESRNPKVPRHIHLSWNNLVLRWDDPWWDIHYPPNDWLCSCGVRSLSARDLKAMGKTGPDDAPKDALMPVIDKATGQMVMQPRGIGLGWDYQPGNLWERGLVPSEILDDPESRFAGEGSRVTVDSAEPIADLVKRARPFVAARLAEGLSPEAYVQAFLQPFGAEIGRAVLWSDPAGAQIAISDQLFRDRSGDLKVMKRDRNIYAAIIAEAIRDPDEIWLAVRSRELDAFPGYADLSLSRRYIRVDPDTGVFAAFEIGRKFWEAVTGFAPRNRSKPDFSYINNQRLGKLLWKRK